MSKRNEHLFQFSGKDISEAATSEAKYHSERATHWNEVYEQAAIEAKTAGVTIKEYDVTGGKRADVIIDTSVGNRLSESVNKRTRHQEQANSFKIESAAYGTQLGRMYELDSSDVIHFRLAGGARD